MLLIDFVPQSYQWVNAQATVHLVVVYFIDQQSTRWGVSVQCFAIISDCSEHDAFAVHAFQCKALEIVKWDLPQVIELPLNIKQNLLSLCYHKQDHNLLVEWNFFAILHGKSACDGVGGTIKCPAAKVSLQRAHGGHNQAPHNLFLSAKSNVKETTVIWVPH